MTLAHVRADDLSDRLEAGMREIQLRRERALAIHRRILSRYAELVSDPAVRQALEAIDRAGTATASLGTGRDTSEALRRIEAALGRIAKPTRDAATLLELQGMNRLRGLIGAADLLLHEVSIDAGHLATIEHERHSREKLLVDRRPRDRTLSETPQKTEVDRAQGGRAATETRDARMRTDRLRSEQDRARVARRDVVDRMAAEQDQFVRVVAAARGLIGEMARPDGQDAGPATQKASPAPPSSRGATREPSTLPYARRLGELEKVIRSEKVAVDVDRGLLWVDAAIDGAHRLKLIVDPMADGLRLAAATATEAGIRPIDGEPAVDLEILDGRTLSARTARIDSVQVGSRILHDVECLVLPPEFGVAPPLLGGGLLRRFSTTIDPNEGTMTLTQLTVKPILRGGEPRR